MADDKKPTRAEQAGSWLKKSVREVLEDYFKDVDLGTGDKPPGTTQPSGGSAAANGGRGEIDDAGEFFADLLGIPK